MRFKKWFLEQATPKRSPNGDGMYNADLSGLTGDPYMDVEWNNSGRLTIRYLWRGYEILPHQRSYSKPNEFGSIELEPDSDDPEYYFITGFGLVYPFQGRGYGSNLLKKAIELLKAKGIKGIKSYKEGRTDSASEFWKYKTTRSDDEADYYEF